MEDHNSERTMLSWDETLFKNEAVFEPDFVPEAVEHRTSQLQGIQHALRPAVRGSRPLNVLAQGPPATGKTTVVRHLFSELERQSGVKTAHINCQIDTTRYAIFSRIFDTVIGHRPPSSGVSASSLFNQITNKLVQDDVALVVALDDLDHLHHENTASNTLHSMLRAHEAYPGTKIGVVAVVSDPDLELISTLDARVQSVFRPEEVSFPEYSESAIHSILEERAKAGFHSNVVTADVLGRVVEYTVSMGDLRVGIDLLRRSGLSAERDARTVVTVDDVESAYEKSVSVYLSRRLQNLSEFEICIVRTIADMDGKPEDLFEVVHNETGLDYSQFSEVVEGLDSRGLIDTSKGDDQVAFTTTFPSQLLEEVE